MSVSESMEKNLNSKQFNATNIKVSNCLLNIFKPLLCNVAPKASNFSWNQKQTIHDNIGAYRQISCNYFSKFQCEHLIALCPMINERCDIL